MNARFVCVCLLSTTLLAQSPQTSLTIYNQNFAVVREEVPLDLKPGENHVNVNNITMHLEPDSVVLRDPTGKHELQILEQNYRADAISEPLLLSLYEGKTIDFEVGNGQVVKGKIIRSGYTPPDYYQPFRGGQPYNTAVAQQPVIEVNGQLRFSMPGTPVFPSLTDDSILKPRLEWSLATNQAGSFPAEFSYVTAGLSWKADYNLVAPDNGDIVDVVGWITMDNQTGKTFENARIKLMAGDVNRVQPGIDKQASEMVAVMARKAAMQPSVTEKAFDEFHLYTLERPSTLRDRETKQVEFIHADHVTAIQIFIYDGANIDVNRYNGWGWENIRNDRSYGTESNSKIWVMREFQNSQANHLGMPLPKGRLRFYRRNDDGQIEFTGENMIDHTPRDETVRVYTGNAFDIAGERRRVDYVIETGKKSATESFEIKIRNHKKEAVKVRVVEHLYRSLTWDIASNSSDYKKTDAHTIEFPVTIAPDGEKVISYAAHYSW